MIYLFFFAFFLQILAFGIWIFFIRPYLKENSRYTLKGMDIKTTIINDVQQVIELSKSVRHWPDFLVLFLVAEIVSLSIIVYFLYSIAQ